MGRTPVVLPILFVSLSFGCFKKVSSIYGQDIRWKSFFHQLLIRGSNFTLICNKDDGSLCWEKNDSFNDKSSERDGDFFPLQAVRFHVYFSQELGAEQNKNKKSRKKIDGGNWKTKVYYLVLPAISGICKGVRDTIPCTRKNISRHLFLKAFTLSALVRWAANAVKVHLMRLNAKKLTPFETCTWYWRLHFLDSRSYTRVSILVGLRVDHPEKNWRRFPDLKFLLETRGKTLTAERAYSYC